VFLARSDTRLLTLALCCVARLAAHAQSAPAAAVDSAAFVRVNQVGYPTLAPKVAVVCALRPIALERFTVEDDAGRTVLGPRPARRDGALALPR